ncbi:MAG: helix-turn-helix domain-containing protein [Candidatus Limnocylindrales bacterium]
MPRWLNSPARSARRSPEQPRQFSPPPERLLGIAEAAAILGVSRTFLYAEINAGRIRTIKARRRRLVAASAIAAYVASRTVAGSPPPAAPSTQRPARP